MKFSLISLAILATAVIAVPVEDADVECAQLVGGPGAFIKDMDIVIKELEAANNITLSSALPKTTPIDAADDDDDDSVALEKRQVPGIITQAACYTVCDRGPDVLKNRVCRFLVGPYRVACYAAALALRTPFGKGRCRNFCNIFD